MGEGGEEEGGEEEGEEEGSSSVVEAYFSNNVVHLRKYPLIGVAKRGRWRRSGRTRNTVGWWQISLRNFLV